MIKLTQTSMDKLKDELSKMKVGPPPGRSVKTKAQVSQPAECDQIPVRKSTSLRNSRQRA